MVSMYTLLGDEGAPRWGSHTTCVFVFECFLRSLCANEAQGGEKNKEAKKEIKGRGMGIRAPCNAVAAIIDSMDMQLKTMKLPTKIELF